MAVSALVFWVAPWSTRRTHGVCHQQRHLDRRHPGHRRDEARRHEDGGTGSDGGSSGELTIGTEVAATAARAVASEPGAEVWRVAVGSSALIFVAQARAASSFTAHARTSTASCVCGPRSLCHAPRMAHREHLVICCRCRER